MKINWFKPYMSLILPLMLIGTGYYLFNWYEVRPAKIKHDCSWTKVIDAAIPAKPAITSEEFASKRGEYIRCILETAGNPIQKLYCGDKPEEPRPEIPAVPEKEWYREATQSEYYFCIHEQGL